VTDLTSDRPQQLRLIALSMRRRGDVIGAEILESVADYVDWLHEELWMENERLQDELTKISEGREQKDNEDMFTNTSDKLRRLVSDRRDEETLPTNTNERAAPLDVAHASTQIKSEAMHDPHLVDRVKKTKQSN